MYNQKIIGGGSVDFITGKIRLSSSISGFHKKSFYSMLLLVNWIGNYGVTSKYPQKKLLNEPWNAKVLYLFPNIIKQPFYKNFWIMINIEDLLLQYCLRKIRNRFNGMILSLGKKGEADLKEQQIKIISFCIKGNYQNKK